MKKQFLRLFSFLALVFLSFSVNAQSNPPHILYFYIYSTNGQEYFGKYWPENTNMNEAITMDQAAKNDNPSNMRLFEGCEDLKLRIMLNKTVPKDTTIYLKLRFNDYSSSGGVNTPAAVNLPDSIPIPSGVTLFEYPYQINHLPEAENGGMARIEGYTTYPNGIEYSRFSDRANFYNRFTYDVETSWSTSTYLSGVKLKIMGATSHVVYSIDNGYTWRKPENEEFIEFNEYEMNQIRNAGIIYIKEPNSCILETITFGNNNEETPPPSITKRPVTLPHIANAIVSLSQGTYYVPSAQNFVFTITPTGENIGLVPVITTNRTSIPDSEGVQIEDNKDGSYTITILYVQQAVNINVDFATGNGLIEGNNNVWASNSELHISSVSSNFAYIYSAMGTLIKTVTIPAGETITTSLPAGIYIVKLNDKPYKVVLK